MTDRIAGSAGTTPPPAAPWWVTMFTPLAKVLLRAGAPLGFNGLITIRGRKTGIARTNPIAIIDVDGRRWVWAPWGGSQWVRNLRAAGRATITVRRRDEEVAATELDEGQRVAFFRETLGPLARRFPLGTWFIRTVDQTDLDDPIGAARDRAVFELHRIG
ncbi:MAG TPA: nitroreductase family deazaflavin-dependent oxidoreductase [Candidatus Limnocylindrales bacterium]|nr:nitroreductase family deazaflavin-dependent oxidoreductase [Candidatus Limnocylindrales bacterium]